MRTDALSRFMLAAAVAGLLAACSDANAPKPSVSDDVLAADLALSAAEVITTDMNLFVGGEVEAMGIRGAALGGSEGASLEGTATCSLGTDGWHTCSSTLPNGLTETRRFAFFDAAGTMQPRNDSVTTASIKFQTSISGTITRDSGSATVSRARNFTLSGLAGQETQRTWNGTGTTSNTSTFTGARGTRTYSMTSKDTTTNVVYALPRASNPWPLSGTVVSNISTTATFDGATSGSRTVSRRAVVTFNGTSTVPLVVGDRTCTLNLETKAVSGCTR